MVALLMTEIFNLTTIKEKSSRSLSYKKFHKRQNDWKGRYNFGKTAKKLKIEVTGPKKVIFFLMFSDKLTKNDVFPFL